MTRSTETKRKIGGAFREQSQVQQIAPWRRAQRSTSLFLYWMPVRFPAESEPKQWLTRFCDVFLQSFKESGNLRPEVFVHRNALQGDLIRQYASAARELGPMAGLSRQFPERQPSQPAPDGPEMKVKTNGIECRSCIWFSDRDDKQARELFTGCGEMTVILRKPGSAGVAPSLPSLDHLRSHPLLGQLMNSFDLSRMLRNCSAVSEGFLQSSIELFGADIKDRPDLRGQVFVLPSLTTSNFLSLEQNDADRLFRFCEVYLAESKQDGGVLMASKNDLGPAIELAVHALKENGLKYQERR